MQRIPSFEIDHTRLKRGVYVSRRDSCGSSALTTFDIRMKEPNREEPLSSAEMHTIEHLSATYLRNDKIWGDRIVYWGPMGCQTGNYLIVKGSYEPRDVLPLLIRMFEFIAVYEGEILGATERECGNCMLQDLDGARRESLSYLEVLKNAEYENLNYPL